MDHLDSWSLTLTHTPLPIGGESESDPVAESAQRGDRGAVDPPGRARPPRLPSASKNDARSAEPPAVGTELGTIAPVPAVVTRLGQRQCGGDLHGVSVIRVVS